MHSNKPISSRMHGMLDYPAGIALIAAPWLFGFSDLGGAAVTVPVVLGIAILAQALITDFEFGVVGIVPLRLHLMVDVAAGAFLALTPVLFSTTDQGLGGWLPHVVVGIALMLAGLLTQPRPASARAGQRSPSAHAA